MNNHHQVKEDADGYFCSWCGADIAEFDKIKCDSLTFLTEYDLRIAADTLADTVAEKKKEYFTWGDAAREETVKRIRQYISEERRRNRVRR